MYRLAWTGLLLAASTWLAQGCGAECGPGTIQKGSTCVVSDSLLTCGPGFKSAAGQCVPDDNWVPYKCGVNTTYNIASGKCEGTGGSSACTPCAGGVPEAGSICISGRVYNGMEYLAKKSGATTTDPTPRTKADNILVRVLNPTDYVTNPDVEPLAKVYLDENGCFLIPSVKLPFHKILTISASDETLPAVTFCGTAWTTMQQGNINLNNLDLLSLSCDDEKALEAEAQTDLTAPGTLVLWFQDSANNSVAGVTPTVADSSLPKFFFSADPSKSPHFDLSATATTASGLVAIRAAPSATYGGTKDGCSYTSDSGGLGGSGQRSITFQRFTPSGC